jgi:hypothetical protein
LLGVIGWVCCSGCRGEVAGRRATPLAAASAAASAAGEVVRAAPAADALIVDAPASAPVGRPVRIEVRGEGVPLVDGDLVHLIGHGGYGVQVWRARVERARAVFELDDETERAGAWTLHARSGQRRGYGALQLRPGPAAAPLVPLVGARSIPADAQSWAMVVAVPQDTRGNPVASGTDVQLSVSRPDGRLEDGQAQVAFGVVWWRLYAGTRAGLTRIALRSGAAHGPEGELREVAGWPLPPRTGMSPATLPADGRSLTTLRSGPMADRFGNRLPDGTRVTFALRGPGAQRALLPALTVNGFAEALLEAPQQPGRTSARAAVHDVAGPPASIDFTAGPAVGRFPLWLERDGDDRRLVAGPLIGSLGQDAPEGTLVRFVLRGPGERVVETDVASVGGRATLRLPEALTPGPWIATATTGDAGGATSFRVTLP